MNLSSRLALFMLMFLLPQQIYSKENKSNNDSIRAKNYLTYADSLNKINKLDSAASYYAKASTFYENVKDWKNVAHCEIWESYMYIDLDQYDRAVTNLNDAITLFDIHFPANNIYSFNCSIKKAVVYFRQNDFLKCIQLLKQSLKLFNTNPESQLPEGEKRLASAYFEYGNNYLELGKIDSAIAMFKKTLEIRDRLYEKNHFLIVDCYNNLGITYSYFGDYETALSYMQRALKSREETKGFAHTLTAWSYTNIGIVNLYSGNRDNALKYALKGLESRKQCLPDNHIEFASSYSLLANIYNETGDFEEALKYHRLALDLYIEKLGENNIRISTIYNNIADNYNKQNKLDKALEYFYKSYKIVKQVSPDVATRNHVMYEHNIADTYFKLNKNDSALFYNSLSLQSNFGPAHKQHNIDKIIDFYMALHTLEQKAEIYMQLFLEKKMTKDLLKANDAYQKYIDLHDFLRLRATEVDSKLNLSEVNNYILDDLINTSWLLHKLKPETFTDEQISALIDKNKANVLEEMLEKTNTTSGINLPDSLAKRWKELSGSLIVLKAEKMLTKKQDEKDKLVDFDERIFVLHEQMSELNDYVQAKFPNFKKGVNQGSNFNISSLKNNEHTAILDYYISDSILFISFKDLKQVTVRTIPIGSKLEMKVNNYLKCIKKNRIGDFPQLSRELHSYLIEPVFDLIREKKKLVIIPDKYLFYLPFETLSNETNLQDFRVGNYLIRDYDIQYHYSTNIYCNYLNQKLTKKKSELNFVGFAPVFEEDSMRIVISSECLAVIRDTTINNRKEILRSFSYDGKNYSSLPYSKLEVNTITDMFSKQNYYTEEYLFTGASEENFKSVCNKFNIIHLASHGFINDQKPGISGIIFSPGVMDNPKKTVGKSETITTGNGILFTAEMYNLKLNADLVVLSACETGLGSIAKGEGVMSMTRGLIYAGASNILYSLWKVGDKNTYELMVGFYSNLLKGNSYAHALRKSKLDLIKKKETAFPKFWSGFTLLGAN